MSSQPFDFIEEGEDRSRPVSAPREAFLGLVYPLVLLVRKGVARLPWFDPGSGLRDHLGKRSNVQSECLREIRDLLEPHGEIFLAEPQEVASRERIVFGVSVIPGNRSNNVVLIHLHSEDTWQNYTACGVSQSVDSGGKRNSRCPARESLSMEHDTLCSASQYGVRGNDPRFSFRSPTAHRAVRARLGVCARLMVQDSSDEVS